MNTFSLNRFINLIKYRFNLHKKIWLLQIGGILGIAMIITALAFINMHEVSDFKSFYQLFYTLSILLSGAYVSSRSFAEYGSTAKGFSYFMLPTSNSEKFMVPALFSGVLYFIIFSLLYSLVAIITNATWSVFYDYSIYIFNPFSESLIKSTGILFMFFMVIQPLFLFGSIALRKNHFILTGIGVFVVFMALILFAMGYSNLVFGVSDYVVTEFSPKHGNSIRNYILVGIFHTIVLIASYFKLKEREV